MTLPPTDPTDPDLDLMLAGAEELSEEELAGLAEPADEDLAKLDERLDEEIARLRDPDARADWYADPDDDYAAESTPLFGGGFAEGGVLDGLGPGPALAGFSQGAVDEGLGGLSDDELVGVLRASWRLSAWQAGVELAAVAELDHRRVRAAERPGSSLADDHVAAELAAALVLTGRSADALLGLARDLARLPAVRKALLEGRIDRARAVVFAAELAGLGDIAAAAVAMGFAGIAGSMTTGQLRAAVKAMVLWLDPAAARRRAEQGQGQARVEAWPEGSGNAGLAGRELPAADAVAADKRITAIARALKDAGAPGTLDQLRAAVFVALLAGRDPESLLPTPGPGQADGESEPDRNPAGAGAPGDGPGGSGPTGPAGAAGSGGPGPGGLAALAGTVHLVMPAAAWLGLSDAPGEAAGSGPLDAWACRDLAARLAAGPATRWQVTLTGPDGRAVAHATPRAGPGPPGQPPGGPPGQPAGPGGGRDWLAGPGGGRDWLAGLRFDWLERRTCSHLRQTPRYQPPDRLQNLIRARQRTCSFPGCRRPATRCDLDHTLPYDQGGPTCECNLSPLCRMHHRTKQAGGWNLTQPEPGVLVWATPHGRTYTVTPDPYLA